MSAPELVGLHVLRGPNIWADVPVVVASLRSDQARYADVIARTAVTFQTTAGAKVSFQTTAQVGPDRFEVIVELEEPELAERCVRAAVDMCAAEYRHEPFSLKDRVRELRDLGDSILLGPNTRAIADAARARGIPVRRLDRSSLLQLGYGARQRRMCGAETDRTSAIAENIGWEKPVSKELLRAVGVPVPEGRAVADAADAVRAAAELGGYVVVKPKAANHGRAVFIGLSEPADIAAAFQAALAEAEDEGVLVERCISGSEHRLLVVEGQVVAVTRGDPLYVTGDGRRTVAELLDEVNRDPRRGDEADCPLSPVGFDDITRAIVERQGYRPDSVPEPDAQVLIQRNGNLGIDVTDRVHPRNAALVALAARTVGLDVAGVDLVVEDISRPMREQGGAVLEVNAMPGLMMHLHPADGKPQPVHERIIGAVFPPGNDGRIPVVAVLGATAREIAAAIEARELLTGVACTEGTFVAGELTHSGNRATASAAEDLLLHPLIEVAVLQLTETDIIQNGLGFRRCDVLVVPEAADPRVTRVLTRVLMPGGATLDTTAGPEPVLAALRIR